MLPSFTPTTTWGEAPEPARPRHRPSSQRFLVAPHLQRKHAFRRVELADDGPGPMPPPLLVEPGGAVVADATGQPGQGEAPVGEPRFRVVDQRGRDARAAGLRRDVELVQLIAFDHGEPGGGAHRAD